MLECYRLQASACTLLLLAACSSKGLSCGSLHSSTDTRQLARNRRRVVRQGAALDAAQCRFIRLQKGLLSVVVALWRARASTMLMLAQTKRVRHWLCARMSCCVLRPCAQLLAVCASHLACKLRTNTHGRRSKAGCCCKYIMLGSVAHSTWR